MDNSYELYIRIAQWYLLLLACFTFLYTLRVGPMINHLRFTGMHIYYSYVFIFLLSMVQIKQCIGILGSPIGPTWWYTMFCKHVSLFVYISIIYCIQTCRQCKRRES